MFTIPTYSRYDIVLLLPKLDLFWSAPMDKGLDGSLTNQSVGITLLWFTVIDLDLFIELQNSLIVSRI